MVRFFEDGGFAMWVILLFGLITLVTAGLYAWKPNHRRYGFLQAMSRATVFASLAGMCAGFTATLFYLSATNNIPDVHLEAMRGIGESLCNPILGFTILGVCWFITAFGERRAERNL
jgi:hypothetical protein